MTVEADARSLLHRLGRLCWALLITALLLLAVYVGAGRYAMANLSPWQHSIITQLNQRLPFVIDAEGVRGDWQFFSPVLVFEGLTVRGKNAESTPVALSRGSVKVDVLASLLSLAPKISEATLEQLALKAHMEASGRLVFPGLPAGEGELGDQLLDFLLALKHVSLIDNSLLLTKANSQRRDLRLNLRFSTNGGKRNLRGLINVLNSGTEIHVVGSGVGDPRDLDNFDGQLFSRFDTGELETLLEYLPEALTYGVGAVTGTAGIDSWLRWRKGEPRVTVTAKVDRLDLKGKATHPWHLTLDDLSFKARLQQRDGVFRLWMNDFNASDDSVSWQLPALQVQVQGQNVQLRAQALHMDQATHFLLASDALPEAAADLITTLRPRGFVSELELAVADYRKPAKTWSGSARFNALAVDPWDYGVGLSGVSGYIRGDHRGQADVLVDTEDFALRVPVAYHHPLLFDTVLATIRLGWSAERLLLHSGLIETTGEEGAARAVLDLNLPFHHTSEGPKMGLLVGLKDSHPRYRKKFVPHVLPADLRSWIDRAVADNAAAKVLDAGFLWRGSLRARANDRRTIQLFVDAKDLALQFDPQWPPLEDFAGLVFVDDERASIWGERGRLYDLALHQVNAEVYRDNKRQVTLGVVAKAEGPAADGLKLINRSPLKKLSSGALLDWQASGQVLGDLDLVLNLANTNTPPVVKVRTEFENLGLTLGAAGLSLTDGSGALRYSTAKGFSSRKLKAKLWGKPLSISLKQHSVENAELDIRFRTDVAMKRVRQWLQAKPLKLASGTAALKGRVSLAKGEAPLLYISSNLRGVALDVPKPWGKNKQEKSSLQVRVPLDGDIRTARVVLGSTLLADIAVQGHELKSASIGIGEEPASVESGQYVLNGSVEELNVEQWQDTVWRYFLTDSDQAHVKLLAVDKLNVGKLQLLGREFTQVRLSAHQNAQSWQIQASNGLAKFSLLPNPDGEGLQIQIPRLDLALFESGDTVDDIINTDRAWPPMAVTVKQLSNKGAMLGSLRFDLAVQKEQIDASNIVGLVSGLELKSDAPGRLLWRRGEFAWTRFDGQLHFSNLGDVLAERGYQRVIETKNGEFSIDMTWPGAPQNVGLIDARGSLQLSVGEGRFLKASTATSNTLRVIGILNLAEFVSRLSLDISPLVKSGIVFDNISGDIALSQNNVSINYVDVNGRSSRFNLRGNANVLAQTMDAELGVVLPVTNNLPLVAAASGAWPLAAGLFLAGQVFGDQIDKIASMVYHVEGPWQDPDVSLTRLFDGNAAQAKKLSANKQGESVVQ
ncbi:MAG: hypothetical protein CR978_02385 [Gammaproteobacteria bacterium]|nr:MAG: hypothetical protein CR978_02385 [Gammaproteobacteria bacterium]